MSIERAKNYLKTVGFDQKITEFDVSSATVELAAAALNVEPARIAKSISFIMPDSSAIIIVTSGDTKIDNHKFKDTFKAKAKMLEFSHVEEKIGHSVGGVCPFGINSDVKVFLDDSLKRFSTVFPACGSSNSAIELTIDELEQISQNFCCWVDICKFC